MALKRHEVREDRQKNKKAFLFATSGASNGLIQLGVFNFFKKFEKELQAKSFKVLNKFDCRGWDTYVMKDWGGLNKGRPNSKDLEKAEVFAKRLIK